MEAQTELFYKFVGDMKFLEVAHHGDRNDPLFGYNRISAEDRQLVDGYNHQSDHKAGYILSLYMLDPSRDQDKVTKIAEAVGVER